MEAKVLRAALSAAIRVTVSTTLVGCGGATVGDGPGDDQQPPTKQEPRVGANGGSAVAPSAPGPAPAHNMAGSYPTATAGSPSGGHAASGGTASGGSGAPGVEGGGPAQPPAPTSLCEEPAIVACEPLLSALAENPPPWDQALDPATLGCCQALVAGVDDRELIDSEPACHAELNERLERVRFSCCPALEFPPGACTPWGPPVPPELDLAQLMSWSTAA